MTRPRLGERIYAQTVGVLTSGAVAAAFLDSFPTTPPERFTQPAVLALSGGGDEVFSTRLRAPAMQFERGEGPGGLPGMPPGFQALWFGPVGRFVHSGDRVCHAFGDTWTVSCWHESGRLLWQTRRSVERPTVTEADKGVLFASTRRMNPRASDDQHRRIIGSFRFAERRPALGRIIAGATGELWVGEFLAAEWAPAGRQGRLVPAATTTWSVLAPGGRWIADVRLPHGFLLLDADSASVAGVERDEDDVERVVVYRIRRR